MSQEPDTFNIFQASSAYSIKILAEIWPSLYSFAPALTAYPNLAECMTVETHDDNAAVPEGHTRFTVDVIQNATWSDGVPLTAEDVAFTYTYFFESGPMVTPLLQI